MNLFLEYYGIPNGMVWSNVAAEPIIVVATLLLAYFFRHWLMARFVAFHHKHKVLHAQKLDAQGKTDETS